MENVQRVELVSEICKHATEIGSDKTILLMALSLTTDKDLVKVHKDYLKKDKL